MVAEGSGNVKLNAVGARLERGRSVQPFAEKDYVDMHRAVHILGVSPVTVTRMAASNLIDRLHHGKRTHKLFRYQSIVDFCSRLREQHRIADRRPELSAAYLRYRDEDLLPFPLGDTISAAEAMKVLRCPSFRAFVRLIEEGHFEAYQLIANAPGRGVLAVLAAGLYEGD